MGAPTQQDIEGVVRLAKVLFWISGVIICLSGIGLGMLIMWFIK